MKESKHARLENFTTPATTAEQEENSQRDEFDERVIPSGFLSGFLGH